MAIASHYSQVLSILPAEGLKLSAVLKLLAKMILGGVLHYGPKRENELPLVRIVNHRTATELMAGYSVDCQSEQLKMASGLCRAVTTMNTN